MLQRSNPRIIAGPKAEGHGRQWFKITAKGGVGEIHIFDFIDAYGVNGRSFLKDLKAIGEVSSLNVHINSPGGDVFEGNTIYNLLKSHKATVTVYIDGLAASIASVIAMAGDKIIMPKNAMMMIHDPSMVAWGTAEDMRKNADVLDKVKKTLVAAYQDKTGLNEAEINTIMSDETWFTADEAVAMKFADQVVDEVKIAAAFDIKNVQTFKNCPPEFMAALAAPAAVRENGDTHSSPPGEHQPKESIMDKEALLALAAALGLAITSNLNTVIERLITSKASPSVAIAEFTALKSAETAAVTTDVIQTAATAAAQTAIAADRARAAGIRAVAVQLKVSGIKEIDAIVDTMIADGTTLDAARAKLIEAKVQHEDRVGPIFSYSGTGQTFDNPAFRRDALATALAHRHQPSVALTDQAKPFASFGVVDMMIHMLEASGTKVQTRDRAKIVAMALHSTSDFPYLLGDVGNKILLPAYEAQPSSYRSIAAQKTFNDFKPTKFLRVGDFPNLLKVGETGEIKRGTMSENRELVTLYSYARILGITRQALINDDLSAFADLAAAGGRRVASFENDTVYAVLAENTRTGPLLADGIVLFDNSTHANYTSSGTAVNVVKELGLMRAKLRAQTSLDSVKLNLTPMILAVGASNETIAEQVTTQITPATQAAVNRIGPRLQLVVDANIYQYNWYLFADPQTAPVLIWGSLPGQAGPVVSTKEGWDTSGVEIKVERDFGTGAIDYRGATLNAGAAAA